MSDSGLVLQLPWAASTDTKLFRKVLSVALIIFFLIAIPVAVIKLPELTRIEKEQLPPQLARVMLEKQELIVAKPVEEPIVEPKKVAPRPAEAKVQEQVEEAKPLSQSEAKKNALAERKELTDSDLKARETAKKSGLLALSNELNDLVESAPATTAGLRGTLTSNNVGKNTAAVNDTSAIGSGVAQGGNVSTGKYGNDVSKTELAARETSKINNELFAGEKSSDGKGGSGKGRSDADVAMVFEKNKNSLNSFYERERRKIPGLQGKVVLQITITPAGDVTQVKIISSELNNSDVEARLIARVKLFKFNAVGGNVVTITYPIELLPS